MPDRPPRRTLRRLTILPLALMLAGCSTAAPQSREPSVAAAIDSLVELWLRVDPTPGVSIAVVERGDTLVMRGYGQADLESGTPVTDRTVFHVGSVTKTFTAAAILGLAEKGSLRLDAAVDDVLPEYAGPAGTATISQLLNHTSGIPSFTAGDAHVLHDPDLTSHREILARIERVQPDFEPGTNWIYNNSGYLLLGLMIERASGATFWRHIEDTQLRPLGLHRSGSCRDPALVPLLAVGYRRIGGGPVPSRPLGTVAATSAAAAAGGLCSTPRDLVRWSRALAAGEILAQGTFERMVSPALAGISEQQRQVGSRYGYGIQLAEVQTHPVYFHSGGFEGFRAVMAHYPTSDLTIAITANGPLPVIALLAEIARLVLGTDRPDHDTVQLSRSPAF
jgi:D-alanyl-D-alanine carboxypeptidase